jgi:penicillin G amidase
MQPLSRPPSRRWRRALLMLCGGLALVGVLCVAAAVLWLRATLPSTPEQIALPGLTAPAQIGWDADGVPDIRAASDADAARVLGWVHARDRLWQMEQQRRAGAGRLAELFGPSLLDIDRIVRLTDLPGRAARSVAALAPETQALIEAYVGGVNAWLEQRQGPLPPEFLITGHQPEPWTAADVLSWGQLMALQLSGDFRAELERARVAERLSPAQRALWWGLDNADTISLPDVGQAALVDWPAFAQALPPALGPNLASNVWVVSGAHTASGKPMLVNDPHLALQAPILWYLARMTTPQGVLAGATVPGVPFVVLGHNDVAAWGMTTTGADAQDLFIERVDPDDPTRYLTPDGPAPFITRQERIVVKGQPDVLMRVRETRHGPVLSDINAAAAQAAGTGNVVALAFTALAETSLAADALRGLNRARSWEEMFTALRAWDVPQQNVAWAHRDGTIAMVSPGRLPVRRAGDGLLPVPGWTGAYDWLRTVPYEVLPAVVNPPSGRIINANNRLVGPDYPHLLTQSWAEDYRARRIEQMLDAEPIQTAGTARAMLADTLSLDAVALLPVLLASRSPHPLSAKALGILRAWDGRMQANETAPLIYAWWLRAVTVALVADELGQPAAETALSFNATAIERILLGDGGAWCDDVTTPNRSENCSDIVELALTETLATLAQRHGDDPALWRWGSEHRATLDHSIFSHIPGLAQITSLAVPSDGGYYTVNRGASPIRDPDAPFRDAHGAGYRAIYDLAALQDTQIIVATGQSGNPLSPHWGDFVARWVSGAVRPLWQTSARTTSVLPGNAPPKSESAR